MEGLFFVLFGLVEILDEDNQLLPLFCSETEFTETCASDFVLRAEVVPNCKVGLCHGFVGALGELRSKLASMHLGVVLDVQVLEVEGRNFFLNVLQPTDVHNLARIEVADALLG